MMLLLLYISSCLPLLSGTTVVLYDGLLTAYLAFRQERAGGQLEGRRSLQPTGEMPDESFGQVDGLTAGNQDELVRTMLTGKMDIFRSGDGEGSQEWEVPTNIKAEEGKHDVCGITKFNAKTDDLDRIVGGKTARHGSWPWIVALGYKEGEDIKFRCGGTLITRKHVLTAAHCIVEGLHSVLLGATEVTNGASKGARHIPIAKQHVHEGYNATHTNDIALLTLQFPVTFTDSIRAACLPLSEHLLKDDYRSHEAYVAGWGALNFNGQASHTLQQLKVPILLEEDCRSAYIDQVIDSRIICAGYLEGSKDACQGDSGGPLVWEYERAYYVIGIVSYGYRCAEAKYPGVYTRVAKFTDWILGAIAVRADTTNSSKPAGHKGAPARRVAQNHKTKASAPITSPVQGS